VNFANSTLEVLAIGFVTGLLSGAFGVGGGIFCTPVLRMVLELPAQVAVGTTLALIIPTSVVGSINYVRNQLVDPLLVKLLGVPAVFGTILGALCTNLIGGPLLMVLFAIVAGVAGCDLAFNLGKRLVQKNIKDDIAIAVSEMKASFDGEESSESSGKEMSKSASLPETAANRVPSAEGHSEAASATERRSDSAEAEASHSIHIKTAKERRSAVLLGLLAGFMAGFFGVGGGFILVPAMLYCFRISVKSAFGTSLLVIAIVSLPATITHALAGHVRFSLALTMVMGAMPGSWLGSHLALKLKDSYLRRGFGFIMLAVAITLAIREVQSIRAY
jgi:hypothetical protein